MILVYNPTCELAVQQDTLNYQPPKQLVEFERQLAPLMMFLSHEGDSIVAEKPSDSLLDFWASKGVCVPEFISKEEAKCRIAQGEKLCPWGVTREVLYRFGGHRLADTYTSAHRNLFSRISSVKLDEALNQLDLPQLFCQDEHPRLVTDEHVLANIIRTRPCVVKTLWSASGRGVSIIYKEEFREAGVQRFSANVRRDGAVVVEPLHDRVCDYAMLFYLNENGEAEYLGKNFYRSDEAGRFGVELIGQNPMDEYVEQNLLPSDWEVQAVSYLQRAIESMNWHGLYSGPIGVDSMLYKVADGTLRIRLCIEANIRHTMGNVNLAISKLVSPNVKTEWTIGNPSKILETLREVVL